MHPGHIGNATSGIFIAGVSLSALTASFKHVVAPRSAAVDTKDEQSLEEESKLIK